LVAGALWWVDAPPHPEMSRLVTTRMKVVSEPRVGIERFPLNGS
jgi:hypothetical protein